MGWNWSRVMAVVADVDVMRMYREEKTVVEGRMVAGLVVREEWCCMVLKS